jgi:hypothetical protein
VSNLPSSPGMSSKSSISNTSGMRFILGISSISGIISTLAVGTGQSLYHFWKKKKMV